MKFRVICQKTSSGAHSPIQVVEQSTGNGVAWINRYLDREYVRRLADKSLYSYAHSLLHFIRWWESVHHTGEISVADLTESTLFDYVRFQSSLRPPPSASTINDRTATADRAIRNQFPDALCQVAHGFHQPFLHRRPMGLGRPRFELSRLRVREPKLNVVPLSVDEVAHFWSSFRNARDLAIVGLMLMQGLRSAEVMALNRDDVLFSEGQLRVPNGIPKGTGFHAFRHAYNALIAQVGSDNPKNVKEVQMQLLRHGHERTNDRYGKSAPPLRQRARQAHINVSDLAMGEAVSK